MPKTKGTLRAFGPPRKVSVLDENEEMQVAYQLLGILQKYAPNGPAQHQCANWFTDMQADKVPAKEMVKQLSGCINDGLRSGNWPWVLDAQGRY